MGTGETGFRFAMDVPIGIGFGADRPFYDHARAAISRIPLVPGPGDGGSLHTPCRSERPREGG